MQLQFRDCSTHEQHQQHVNFAARYLDVHHPGWFSHIDTQTLDMTSCMRCVIGQGITRPVHVIDSARMWTDEMDTIFGKEWHSYTIHSKIRVLQFEQDELDQSVTWDRNKEVNFPPQVFAGESFTRFWIEEIQLRQRTFVVPLVAPVEVTA